jgi:hypothetical protein
VDSRILSAEHSRQSGVAEPWKEGNEAWWDWYLSLAAGDAAPAELVEVSPPAAVAAPSLEELRAELAVPYVLRPDQLRRFRAEGYLKVSGVLTGGALARARAEIERLAEAGAGPGRSGYLNLDLMWRVGSEVLALFATTYFADGARLVDSPTMVSGDFEKFLPGARPGAIIDTPLNPIVSR